MLPKGADIANQVAEHYLHKVHEKLGAKKMFADNHATNTQDTIYLEVRKL
jgi:hypothetical protein